MLTAWSVSETAMSESLSEDEQDSDVADVNAYAVSLPECSYSSAFIMLHTMRYSSVGMVIRILVVFPEVMSCVLIVAVQLWILSYLWEEVQLVDACSIQSSKGLQWTAAAIFVGQMMAEFGETLSMLIWIWGNAVVDIRVKQMDEPNPLLLCHKVLAVLLLLVPKLIVACVLTFVGTYFVFLSESNTDLILNCLAMTFVVELDELAYSTISSEFSKKEVQNVRPLVLHSSELAFCDAIVSPILRALLWAAVVWGIFQTLPEC